MTMWPIWAFGAAWIGLASLAFSKICEVKKDKVFSFIKLMLLITLFRVILGAILSYHGVRTADPSSPMNTIVLPTVLGVYWEDAVFTLPILVMERVNAPKWLINVLLGISSVAFASGHIPYSLFWAAITLLYVPFISYKYGKANGLGTVMVCHIIYDLFTLATFKLLG